MKNRQWEAIYDLYARMEKLCGRSLYVPEEMIHAGAGENPEYAYDGMRMEPEMFSSEDIINIRAELRTQLDFLKAALVDQYSERDTYMILFAVVAQIDELIQANFLHTMNISWPLLQKELFQIDNAGEVYYEILDDILPKPQTHIFIYEVYYFCLRYGFRGRYESNPAKIAEYLKKLQAKLQQEESLEPSLPEAEEIGKIRHFGAPYWSYVIVVVVLIAAYLAFMILGGSL